jgi:hydroxymethylpyrimidine/phosphomethylpyrimidine kinase
MEKVTIAMTIAGSDSGGGAGIQADLRTFAFHRVHGASAITCVTAQNTTGVSRVDAMPLESISAQIEAIAVDLRVGAVKTGMLLNAEIIQLTAKKLTALGWGNVVVDPVMVSRAGAQLLADSAVELIKTKLLPIACVVTPNRYEAQILAGMEITSLEDMHHAAQKIHQLGARTVLVKGGGMAGALQGIDVWFDGRTCHTLQTELVNTIHTHGTGCTLSAAIAANLALGKPLKEAIVSAKDFVTRALQYPLVIGSGQGTIGHFYPLMGRGD